MSIKIFLLLFLFRWRFYNNDYITVVNDMDWIPCRGELSNNFCFCYVGSHTMNHKYIGNEDPGKGNVYFDRGKTISQCQNRQKDCLGCLFHMTVDWTIN